MGMGLFIIVPIFVGVVSLLIGVQIIKGIAAWSRNNGMPVETLPARVVAKRTHIWGSGGHHHHGHASTNYFATFELKSGERMESGLYGDAYGLLAEGDQGELTFQGTRYHGFRRSSGHGGGLA